jgi:hypothetical protein
VPSNDANRLPMAVVLIVSVVFGKVIVPFPEVVN